VKAKAQRRGAKRKVSVRAAIKRGDLPPLPPEQVQAFKEIARQTREAQAGAAARNAELAKGRQELDRPLAVEIWKRPIGAPTVPSGQPRRKRSRQQELVLQVAADCFPDGYEHKEPGEIIKGIGDELKRRGKPVPKRDVFLRAFDFRK